MTKHTKGPWKARKNGEIGVIDKSDTQSFGMMLVICRVDAWDLKESSEANAKLIAAAPELLAALEYMLAVCRADDENGDAARNEARVAIAKAKGE